MKINVRYFTEVGSDSTTMEIDELASWIKRRGFNISSIKEKSKSYSEEEVLEIIRQYALEEHLITSSKPDIWFEQFKKK